MNKKTIVSVSLVIIIFVSSLAGTIIYYNSVLNDRNFEIAMQKNEISNLTSQIQNLTGQVGNLTARSLANIVTYLGIRDVDAMTYYYLDIAGSAYNTGKNTAFNAGLHVTAYTANGTLEINMTVPLGEEMVFGTDNATQTFSSYGGERYSPIQIGTLYSSQATAISIKIYHEGIVTNWTVTPLWTNNP